MMTLERCVFLAHKHTTWQVVSYPLALIRTRLQAQGIGGRAVKYTGMGDVLSKTWQREGLRGV
jgi:solute carrier family 25 phosphate transporter 23/24/25/41